MGEVAEVHDVVHCTNCGRYYAAHTADGLNLSAVIDYWIPKKTAMRWRRHGGRQYRRYGCSNCQGKKQPKKPNMLKAFVAFRRRENDHS